MERSLNTAANTEDSARDRIMRAGEMLFAESGFDGASLRQIALKAGVPVGLVGYHFDGKLGLYRAIFEARTPAIVEQRAAGVALAALEDDPDRRLELVVKAVLLPMLKLRAGEHASLFGTLLAREVSDPRSIDRGIVKDMLDPVSEMVTEQLRLAMPHRSEAEIHWSYQMIIGVMVWIMADAGRISRLSGGLAEPDDTEGTLRHVLPMLLDGLRGVVRGERR